jgi:cell wall-associated NlpC family hydrolase
MKFYEYPDWIERYIGIEFEEVGRAEFCDCWGLVRRMYHEQFKIELPSYDEYENTKELNKLSKLITDGKSEAEWLCIEKGSERLGDVILFQMQGFLCHVGFVLGNNKMLHIQRGKNSCIEDYNGLRWNKRVHSFYRHVNQL